MPSIKFNTDGLTTNTGTPVANNMYSLRAGNRGPVLLEDYHLLEKLGQVCTSRVVAAYACALLLIFFYLCCAYSVADVFFCMAGSSTGRRFPRGLSMRAEPARRATLR